jgi:predicted regulator of Ras-like GTPase activity (Roadblock/LC7/MglB family)
MEDIKDLRGLLKKIRDSAAVTDALLMTKTGMFVQGSMRRSTSLERFLGMSAILMGSAEAFSIELKDDVKGVVVRTKNSKIAIVAVTDNVILVVKYFGKKDDQQILEELQQIIGSNQYSNEI